MQKRASPGKHDSIPEERRGWNKEGQRQQLCRNPQNCRAMEFSRPEVSLKRQRGNCAQKTVERTGNLRSLNLRETLSDSVGSFQKKNVKRIRPGGENMRKHYSSIQSAHISKTYITIEYSFSTKIFTSPCWELRGKEVEKTAKEEIPS